jgi:hypothetical protein
MNASPAVALRPIRQDRVDELTEEIAAALGGSAELGALARALSAIHLSATRIAIDLADQGARDESHPFHVVWASQDLVANRTAELLKAIGVEPGCDWPEHVRHAVAAAALDDVAALPAIGTPIHGRGAHR